MGNDGHKSNWLTILKTYAAAIKAVTDNLPDGGSLSDLAAIKTVTDNLPDGGALSDLAAIKTIVDNLPDGGSLSDLAAILEDTGTTIPATLANLALESTLTAIKGGGWSDETLVAIKAAIDAISAGQAYQEQIPDTDFALAAIDDTLTAPPPSADAENSVVDIDQNAGDTFVLRSLWVNVTSFGTNGTKLTFKLWVPVNGVVTKVDEVDVDALGIQNLMDIFGLQEVHADGIWVTVQTDGDSSDAACSGTYRYAKAST
jgi:hypothetical protein